MRLVRPSEEWRAAFVEMAREYSQHGNDRYELATRDFAEYLRQSGERRDRNEYWLQLEEQILACGRLRLELTPELEIEGGHIGYDVRPNMRRRGHGTELLRLMLREARALGITRVLVTCDDDNIGSSRIIESNGGVLSGRGISEDSGKLVRQYWIANS